MARTLLQRLDRGWIGLVLHVEPSDAEMAFRVPMIDQGCSAECRKGLGQELPLDVNPPWCRQ